METSADTPEFAARSIRNWWLRFGQKQYPGQSHLLIEADSGGSNGCRPRLWKRELQRLSNETGLTVTVCWEAEYRHLKNDTRPIMTWDHWPEAWETSDLTAYRSGFLTGREACQWIADTLGGPEPAVIWGLSGDDVARWCYDALARLPDVDRHWLYQLAATSGLHPEDRDELWPLFDEACRNAPAWLCQFDWDIAERFTHAALVAHGVGVEPEGSVMRGHSSGRSPAT